MFLEWGIVMKKLGFVLAAIVAIMLAVDYYAYTMVGVGFAVAIAGALVLKGQSVPAWVLSKQKPIGFGLLGAGLVVLILGASSVSSMKTGLATRKAEFAAKQAQVEELIRKRCSSEQVDEEFTRLSSGVESTQYKSALSRLQNCRDEVHASMKNGN